MTERRPVSEQQLDDAATQMELDVQPARDLWPDIQAALPQRRGRGYRYWALAASVAIIALAAGLFAPQTSPPPFNVWGALEADGEVLQALEQQRSRMLEELSGSTAAFPPGERMAIAASLEGLQAGRASVDAALRGAPNDSFLQAKLVAATTDELAMIQHITELAQGAARRTQL